MDGDGTAPPAHAARKPFRWRFPRRRLRDDPDLTLGWLSALSGDHAEQHAAVVSRNPGGLSRVVSAGSIRRPRRGATVASARPSRHARRRSGHCVTYEPSEHAALGYGSRSVRTVPLVRSTALNLRFFVPRSRLSVMLTTRRRLSSRSSAVFPSGAAIEQADSEIPEPPRSFRGATAARRHRHPGESRDRSPGRVAAAEPSPLVTILDPDPSTGLARIEERATNDGRGPPASGRRE